MRPSTRRTRRFRDGVFAGAGRGVGASVPVLIVDIPARVVGDRADGLVVLVNEGGARGSGAQRVGAVGVGAVAADRRRSRLTPINVQAVAHFRRATTDAPSAMNQRRPNAPPPPPSLPTRPNSSPPTTLRSSRPIRVASHRNRQLLLTKTSSFRSAKSAASSGGEKSKKRGSQRGQLRRGKANSRHHPLRRLPASLRRGSIDFLLWAAACVCASRDDPIERHFRCASEARSMPTALCSHPTMEDDS